MANLDFQIQAINNTLAKLPKQMEKTKRKVELAAGRSMIKAIRAGTPVSNRADTKGDLKRSVGRITGLRRAVYTYIGIRIGKKVTKGGYYAEFLEFGSVRYDRKPFFKKAAKSGVSVARKILVGGVKVGLKDFELKNRN